MAAPNETNSPDATGESQNPPTLKEGSRTCEGVELKWNCSGDSWFGTCAITVDKCFLYKSGLEISTKRFQIAENTWHVRLDNKDGYLGAYLYSENKAAVQVHRGFTVVNQNNAELNKSNGCLRKFSFHKCRGSPQLASIAEIKAETSGFLKDNAFIVNVEIRLKTQENEDWTCIPDGNSGICTWRLKNLLRQSPWLMMSEEFIIGGRKWTLEIHPQGDKHDGKHLAFYLISRNDATVRARYSLTAVNGHSSEKNISKNLEHVFDHYNAGVGSQEFLKTEALEDASLGFLEDRWITLTARIKVLNQLEAEIEEYEGPNSPVDSSPATEMSQADRPLTQQDAGDTIEASDAASEEDPIDAFAVKDHDRTSQQTGINAGGQGSTQPRLEEGDLEKLKTLLKPSTIFADKYLMGEKTVPGKPHVRFATNKLTGQAVVLKFYSREEFQRALQIFEQISDQYVCKYIDWIDDDRLGVPPCLVFERGSCTLGEWIQEIPAELFKRKVVLFDVLQCLKHIHSQNIVHCDIKPSNIMFFPSSHLWKLLDTGLGVKQGEPYPIQYTLLYAAPEVIQAEESRQTMFYPETSMDMWAFGVLAFEILTGKRLYGDNVSQDTIKDYLLGKRQLPSLEGIEGKQWRLWLRGLLSREPRRRFSAEKSLNHDVFKTAEETMQKEPGFRQVGKCSVKDEKYNNRTYKMSITNLCNLDLDEEVESETFEVQGKKWKIGLLRLEHNSKMYDIVKIVFVSCNAEGVTANVDCDLQFNKKPISGALPKRKLKTADRFDILFRFEISIDELTRSEKFQPNDELVVVIDLKDVRKATESELNAVRILTTVRLEVINKQSIDFWLNRNVFGLARPTRFRHSDVSGRSLVRTWAMKSPNQRYWLCQRNDGFSVVSRYLNESKQLERFEEISTEQNGGYPWVSVFEETKEDGCRFTHFDQNSLLIFCKLFAPPYKDVSYLGHLVVQKTKSCQEVIEQIKYEMAKIPDTNEVNAYVEKEGHCVSDITYVSGPLPEAQYEENVGHVIILRERQPGKSDPPKEEVEKKLRAIHRGNSNVQND